MSIGMAIGHELGDNNSNGQNDGMWYASMNRLAQLREWSVYSLGNTIGALKWTITTVNFTADVKRVSWECMGLRYFGFFFSRLEMVSLIVNFESFANSLEWNHEISFDYSYKGAHPTHLSFLNAHWT